MRVLHLVGSPTSEFMAELSRLYARGCLEVARDVPGHEPLVADVSPDGSWRLDDGDPVDVGEALARIRAWAPDVGLPQLFCHAGMTHYRALLDVLGIPYVGNRPDTMAIAADKAKARALVAAAGVAVPDGEVLRAGESPTLTPPVVVKPVDADNSHGVTLVRDLAGYPTALDAAFASAAPGGPGDDAGQVAAAVLVERFVELGREVRCATLERDGELVVLPLEEYAVDAESKPIRDAADKLGRDADGELQLMAKNADHAWIVAADDPANAAIGAAARACHAALGCRHYGLFDFRLDPDGTPFFLEAGPYCSFAPGSVVATMARAAGIPTADLLAEQLALALRG